MNKIVSFTGNGTVSAGPDPDLRTASSCVKRCACGVEREGDHKCLKREYDDQKLYEKQKDGHWKS